MKKMLRSLSLILALVLAMSLMLSACGNGGSTQEPDEPKQLGIALLPEPKVTVVKSKNADWNTSLDLTAEWEKVSLAGSLVQSCIIIRKEFADAHPAEVAAFLKEYETSVNFVNEDIDAAAELIAQAGIISQAALAKKAIPGSNIKYSDGAEMKAALSEFYNILYSVEPKSIGGKLPNDDLYYTASEATGQTVDKNLKVNVTLLSGPTGMGMAKLMSNHANEKSALSYNFNVISDATQINAGIIGGTIDIAAAPTNLASVLYSKTNGGVYVLATSALGVLYLLEDGQSIESIEDLKGQTIYIPGQGTNPEYILKYVLEKNGLTVGTDVFFDYTYNTPDTLSEAVIGGLIKTK